MHLLILIGFIFLQGVPQPVVPLVSKIEKNMYSNQDSVVILLQSLKKEATRNTDKNIWGYYYLQLGTHKRIQSEYDSAIYFMRLANEIFEETGNLIGIGASVHRVGILREYLGDYESALIHYHGALENFTQANDPKSIASVYSSIGITYKKLQRYDEAIKYYKKSMQIRKEYDVSDISEVATLNNIGSAYIQLKKYDTALLYLNEAMLNTAKGNLERLRGYVIANMAEVFALQGDMPKSKVYYKEAISILEKQEDQYGFVNTLLSQAGLVKDAQAIPLFEEVYKRASKLRLRSEASVAAKNLAQLFESKDKNLAYQYLKYYSQYQDTLQNEEKERSINAIELNRRELENNRLLKEIETGNTKISKQSFTIWLVSIVGFLLFSGLIVFLFMWRQRTRLYKKLSQQNKQLESEKQMQDKMLSVIAHDLRNPLNFLSGILTLQKEGSLSEDEFREYSNKALVEIQNSSQLLENLLLWAKSHSVEVKAAKEPVNISDIVKNAIHMLIHKAQEKSITIRDLSVNRLTLADKNMIETVIRNLIDNAIKFTGKNGTIEVLGYLEKNKYYISVKDSGVGIPKEKLEKLQSRSRESFTTRGTENERGTGFGLEICREFIEKNGGQLTITSEIGQGSIFTFSLDLA